VRLLTAKKEMEMFKFTKRQSAGPDSVGAPAAPVSHARLDGAQVATLAAGCFWSVEAAYREIEGVLKTRVGYTGGQTPRPTYERVCAHGTGHAEAVEVWFDPSKVSYEQLLQTFWRIHNPTTRNRQGFDVGSQYRSAVFVHDADQAALAAASRDREQQTTKRPIVTEITPACRFYEAEEYHQRYFEKQGRAACAVTLG
jgi:peptide-methionine (S)-S-oxide reductase